jgi:hypothetical protein
VLANRQAVLLGGNAKPSLDLYFSKTPAIPSSLTTSRSVTATVMAYAPAAVAGDIPVVTTCAVNEVRFQNARRISQGVWSNVLSDGSAIPLPITLLQEEARTNLLLNSATPATQNVTTTAQSYTISMWGTGTCTLTGTATGTLTGTSATARVSLTVTATAGTLTLTFAGTNTNGQAEAGLTMSSYIVTAGTAVTRTVDNASFTGTGLSSWYNPTQGTFVVTASGQYSSAPGNIGVWNQLLTNSGTYVITYDKNKSQSAYLYTPNAQAGVSPLEYQKIPTPTTILLGEQGILNLSKFTYYPKALKVNKAAMLPTGTLTTSFDTSYAATTNFSNKFAASAGATAFPFGTRCIYFPKINTSAGTLFDFAWDGNNLMGNSGGSFPAIDVSHGTTFTFAWRGCAFSYFLPTNFTAATDMTAAWRTLTTLIAMPAGLNFPSATNFNVTWQNCSALTTFPANAFDNSKATVYTSTFTGCALTQTSVDNILVSINQSRINTPSLINGTLNMTGGTNATPSATGLAAKAALVAAGWTVTTN